jgi:hypothetical protein
MIRSNTFVIESCVIIGHKNTCLGACSCTKKLDNNILSDGGHYQNLTSTLVARTKYHEGRIDAYVYDVGRMPLQKA